MDLYDIDKPHVKTTSTDQSSCENIQRCQKCTKTFPTSQQLLQHSLVHSNLRKFPCTFCDKSFKQLSHLQQHQRIHTGERPYRCVIGGCTKAFRQLSSLQQHLKGHSLNSKKEVKNGIIEESSFPPKPHDLICQICEKQCSNEQRFFKHMNKYHPEYWRVFSGGQPLSKFVAPDTTSSSRDNPFLCFICNKRYIHRTGYVKHLSSHAGGQRTTPLAGMECKVCKKVFSKEAYLVRHLEMKSDTGHKMALEEMKRNALSKNDGDFQLFERDSFSCPSTSIDDPVGRDAAISSTERLRDDYHRHHLPSGDANSSYHSFPPYSSSSEASRSPESSNRVKCFSSQVYAGGSPLVKNQSRELQAPYQDPFLFANGFAGPSLGYSDVPACFHYGNISTPLEYCSSYQSGFASDPDSAIHGNFNATLTPFQVSNPDVMDQYFMRAQHFHSRYTSFR